MAGVTNCRRINILARCIRRLSYQTGFRLSPFRFFTYEVKERAWRKSVFMVRGETRRLQYEVHALST
jgi:hypothetical protein